MFPPKAQHNGGKPAVFFTLSMPHTQVTNVNSLSFPSFFSMCFDCRGVYLKDACSSAVYF